MNEYKCYHCRMPAEDVRDIIQHCSQVHSDLTLSILRRDGNGFKALHYKFLAKDLPQDVDIIMEDKRIIFRKRLGKTDSPL